MRRLATLLCGVLLATSVGADIIRTSLLIMEPGDRFFSCTGHSGLRMESEERSLDKCFSYESEGFGFLLAHFLSGHLKMGMFRIPTEGFLEPYAQDRRGVKAYRLDLPQDVQRALWKVLDEKADEGIELPYDYLQRGCAQSVLQCIMTAVERCGRTLEFPVDKPYYHSTCREAFGRSIPDCPWTFFFLHLIVGTDADEDGPRLSRIRVPADLLDLLRTTTLDGKCVVADEGAWLVPPGEPVRKGIVTPTRVALLVLLMVAVAAVVPVSFSWLSSVMTAVLLSVCTAIGCITAYTVFCVDLPGATWNWLLVPFNPLLALFWRWRRKWAIAYVFLVLAWLGGLWVSSHTLTHPAYQVLAVAAALQIVLSSWDWHRSSR